MLQLENYIQESMRQEMVQIHQNVVHNHTATMIEIGSNLLSQTAEQTRKLTNVEAQVRTVTVYHTLFECLGLILCIKPSQCNLMIMAQKKKH